MWNISCNAAPGDYLSVLACRPSGILPFEELHRSMIYSIERGIELFPVARQLAISHVYDEQSPFGESLRRYLPSVDLEFE